jgi:asparagine synthase (glutamine-hydrolysing)
MSVQFGRWNFDGQPPSPEYVEKVGETLAPYGPDSNESYSKEGVKILYRAFCTTKESWREKQPHVSLSGAVMTWDGRLDNRTDLLRELPDSTTAESTDIAIAAAAYEKWGEKCFTKLIGDWAFSVWNPHNQALLLAKDAFGSRHLYYSCEKNHATWCTILDPLVLFAGRTFTLCEEYIAGWFSQVPAAHLTPYVGISSVPPASYVLLRPGKESVRKYWDFDPGKRISYRTDAEYEEHFRAVFATAVQRKLRSDRPVLADLSGGMDSGSIVCMADVVMARGQADCPRIDTISWYDDSYDHLEPDFNELHWVAKVEAKRGHRGYHINLAHLKADSSQPSPEPEFENDHFAPTPYPSRERDAFFKQYASLMKSNGHRVALSGVGGEIPTGGGSPSPIPELQNLLSRTQFLALSRQLRAWASKMKTARLPLLWQAARGFLVPSLSGVADPIDSASPWFDAAFVRRNRAALLRYPTRTKLFGPLPSIQNQLNGLEYERRLLATFGTAEVPLLLRDVRYPFMDRDLREFACAIPWEQLVRVGQRRSLLRRALRGIVPEEILKRRTKGFIPPDMKKQGPTEQPRMFEIGGQAMISASIGIINATRFFDALQKARRDEEGISMGSLTPTLTLEAWLRHLTAQGVLASSISRQRKRFSPLEVKRVRTTVGPKV